MTWSVVVPTVGRPVVDNLLADLAAQSHQPESVVVVDDRRRPDTSLDVSAYPEAQVVASGGSGTAAARNVGGRATATTWVVFLDDDVRLPVSWSDDLLADLGAADSSVAGVQ